MIICFYYSYSVRVKGYSVSSRTSLKNSLPSIYFIVGHSEGSIFIIDSNNILASSGKINSFGNLYLASVDSKNIKYSDFPLKGRIPQYS